MQGRFKAILVERDSYLLERCRYVVLNPLRARITRKPESYRWSSYRSTVGLEPIRACLSTDWLLAQFGKQRASAQRMYQRFVAMGVREPSPWNKVQGQILLGGDPISLHACSRACAPSRRSKRCPASSALRPGPR